MKIDVSDIESVVINKSIRSGQPVVKGTRFPVARVLTELAAGGNIDELAEDYNLDVHDLADMLNDLADKFEVD